MSQTIQDPNQPALRSATTSDVDVRALNVLVVHRYFWPDTPPVASILRSICDSWADAGHDVSVYTSQPCYKPTVEIPRQPSRQTVGKLNVLRCWLPLEKSRNPLLRLMHFLMFLSFAFCHIVIRRKKYDLVMGLTFPPVISGFVLSAAAKLRGSKFVYYCMDIHPESSTYTGKLKKGSIKAKIARTLDRRTCDSADAVVVLSQDMANTFLERYKDAAGQVTPRLDAAKQKMHIISDFNPTSFGNEPSEVPSEFQRTPGKFRLVYAGNVGMFQALDNVVRAAQLLADQTDIEIVILGEGAAKKRLIEMAGDLNGKTVLFYPHQPVAVADKIIQAADLAIVSLMPDVFRVAHPCKTSSYLAMGCPLLMVIEEESRLYQMTVENNLGYACRGEAPEALKETILTAYHNRDKIEAMREPAKLFAQQHLVKEVQLVRWKNLINQLAQSLTDSNTKSSKLPRTA
ncbi:MAG: glycosyltransferase family 4 protein [Mariniblastus sp.]